jgi:hypothetical protein
LLENLQMLGDHGEIYNKFRGLGVRFVILIEFLNFSPTEKPVDPVHGAVDWWHGSGPRWTSGSART